jgi:hypothetical protein
MEIFHTPDDDLVFCEVASRTGGLRTARVLELGVGLPLDKAWFRAAVGKDVALGEALPAPEPGRLAGYVAVYPKSGVLTDLPSHPLPSWVVQQKIQGRVGERYHGGYKSGDALASFVLVGETESQLRERCRVVAESFEAGVRYAP